MHGTRWSSRAALAIALILANSLPPASDAADGQGGWRTNYASALAEAERDQKPLLIHFSATWCLPCATMDRDVLKSTEIKKLLGNRVIGVKVDSDQHPQLVKQYGIQLLPSDVLVNPLNGRVIDESQGAMDLKRYVSFAVRGEGKFQQILAQRQAKPQKPLVQSEELVAATEKNPAESQKNVSIGVDLGTPQALVGLDGFSPVALTKHRQWVRGSASFTWDYHGVIYQLATQAELEEFRHDPAAYAPRLLGCDPVVLWETDRVIPGRTHFGAFYDDELYLFTSAENRKRFKANPQRFMKTQHVLKVDQIDRTAHLDGSHLK